MSRPGSSILLANSVKFGLAYWSLSVAVNVVVTALIVLRLYTARRRLAEAMGTAGRDSGKLYTNVSAILVESAALYTIPAIIFLVGYGIGDVLNASVDALEVIQVRQNCTFSYDEAHVVFVGHRATSHHSASRQWQRVLSLDHLRLDRRGHRRLPQADAPHG